MRNSSRRWYREMREDMLKSGSWKMKSRVPLRRKRARAMCFPKRRRLSCAILWLMIRQVTSRKACQELKSFRVFRGLGGQLGWYANSLLIGLTLFAPGSSITAAVSSPQQEASASARSGAIGPRIQFENPIFDFGQL